MVQQLKKLSMLVVVCLLFSLPATAQDGKEFHLDEVYEMDANGTLNLSSADADVRIIGSNRSDVHVKIDRVLEVRGISSRPGDFDVEVENDRGNLYIRERRRSRVRFSMGYSRLDYTILIELPESASLRIKGDDDDYFVKNVNGEISMDVDDGDIELEACNGNKFDFRMEDGDLKMDGGKGEIYANMDDGDIIIRDGAFKEIDLEVQDGDVSVETSIVDDGSYDIQADDANIEFYVLKGGGEFIVTKDDGSVRSSSEFETISETDYRSRLRLDGGKAEVQIRMNDGRVRLNAGD